MYASRKRNKTKFIKEKRKWERKNTQNHSRKNVRQLTYYALIVKAYYFTFVLTKRCVRVSTFYIFIFHFSIFFSSIFCEKKSIIYVYHAIIIYNFLFSNTFFTSIHPDTASSTSLSSSSISNHSRKYRMII